MSNILWATNEHNCNNISNNLLSFEILMLSNTAQQNEHECKGFYMKNTFCDLIKIGQFWTFLYDYGQFAGQTFCQKSPDLIIEVRPSLDHIPGVLKTYTDLVDPSYKNIA